MRTWARYGVVLAGGFIAGNRAVGAAASLAATARASCLERPSIAHEEGTQVRHLALGIAALAAWAWPGGSPDARVTQVAWLAGCWELRPPDRVVEEQWTRPRGGLMLGVGRTVRGDSLVEYEQVRIFERGGRLVYGANPRARRPRSSRAPQLSDSAVTFENLGHDFPQRVMYRRSGADSLVGRVEGTEPGQAARRGLSLRSGGVPLKASRQE